MIMKRVYLFVLFIVVCTFTGCGLKISEKENEKLSRIEICDADGSSIAVLEDQSSSDVKSFFEDEMWVSEEQPDETLTPQYTIYLYHLERKLPLSQFRSQHDRSTDRHHTELRRCTDTDAGTSRPSSSGKDICPAYQLRLSGVRSHENTRLGRRVQQCAGAGFIRCSGHQLQPDV